ncbi:MAG: hypothetical protein HS107_07220 [Thermoflexaceae bacterium]|nr:hypothetical protein [Thermoflexaceae bacterium]
MAAAPRRGIKNMPARAKEQGEEVRAAQPAAVPKAPEKGSLDVFDRVAPATRPEPKLTPPPAGQQDDGGKGDAAATPVAAAKPAVAAAARAGEATKNREEPAFQGDRYDPTDGPKTPGTDPGDRIPAGITGLTGAADKGVPTRTGSSDDGAESSAPFIDSGRAALEAQVDAVLGSGEAAASAPSGATVGSTGTGTSLGPKGTPADLGMTGDPGGQGGQTSIGMDVFDTALPARGVATASGELGILQGMLPIDGAGENAAPSVAAGETKVTQIDTELDGAPVGDDEAKVDQKPVKSQEEESIIIEGLREVAEAVEEAAPYIAAGIGVAAIGAALIMAPPVGLAGAAAAAALMVTPPASEGTPAGSPGAAQPVDPETAGHPELTAGYMAFRAAGRERLGLGTPLDGEGDTDPAREGTDTGASGGEPTDTVSSGGGSSSNMNMTIGMMETAWRQFLVGQPVEGQTRGGQFDPTGGTLPGDMGNIDFGPDSTGQHTSDTHTEEPEDALNSLGGSGLSIEDFGQGKSSGDDSESDEESSDSESEES